VNQLWRNLLQNHVNIEDEIEIYKRLLEELEKEKSILFTSLRNIIYLLYYKDEDGNPDEYNVFVYETVKYPTNGKPHKTIT
jgi:hypothetical protein